MDVDVRSCARCGQDHTLAFDKLTRPTDHWTHWAMCENTGEPVWLSRWGDDYNDTILDGERFMLTVQEPCIIAIDGAIPGMLEELSIRIGNDRRHMVIARDGMQVRRPIELDNHLTERDGVMWLTGRFLDD